MFTKPFSQLSKTDADIAGGKGASLGEMLQSNIPVPDGYVVLSTTFDEFLHKSDLAQEIDSILESVDHKTISSVESASEKIQELIKHASMPDDIKAEIESQFSLLNSEFVAVRSSATAEDGADHAWAGQLESYLNTTQDTLLEKVQHCWASLFTPRAIFYRFEKGLDTTKISVAVVVQKMVNSEKSGIAFSVHPVTEDRNQIIIEAGFGLGEAIVSGSVTPDSYVISKQPREIIDINISNQTRAMYRKTGGGNEWLDIPEKGNTQVFNDSEILALSEIILTIENHYGFPCDIEWAYEDGTFYIVQSRPITTLSKVAGPKISFEKAYTRDTTMIIQQGWSACVTNPFYASGKNPFTPPVIHYMNDGVIEIWENEKATQWIMDSFQDLIKSDESKLVALVDQYEKDLVEIKEYWEKGPITNVDEFVKYVDRVFVVMKGFDCMYFPSVDERTPAHIRERMLKLRDADTYFDSNDKLMRASLIALYPELKGCENCILKSEIKNPPSLEILKARKESFVVIGEEFAEQTIIREYLAKHPEYHFHIEIPPADSSTLIGQVGNKGYAKGIVRIMKRKEQIGEAQEGDIIVSTMTTPDFVPAMQKAAGIITDEGGITCHAAIVARELNKPCVIGTKFATEILKDGDLVEVDADNGVVRVLERNISTLEKITRLDWKKEWAGNWSFFTGNMLSRGYVNYFNKQLGFGPQQVLLISKENYTTCYITAKDKDDFGNGLADLFNKDKSLARKWSQDLKNAANKTMAIFDDIESQGLTYDNFQLLVQCIHDYALTHWIVKSVVNYISSKDLVAHLKEFEEARLYSEPVFDRLEKVIIQSFQKIAQEKNIDIKILFAMSRSEFEMMLRDEEFGDIKNRFQQQGILVTMYDDYPINKNEIDELVKYWSQNNEDSIIRGSVGQAGKVIGPVRIINDPHNYNIFNKGDILVSSMTRPEFLLLMQKSGGIVTDGGGILCHAAIIARELNIPCVIGTENATSLLKEGDLVEVDADNGVVKIISNKKSVAWEKVLQRNFPPLAWTAGGYYEFHGLNVGPMTWIREREMQVKYNTVQSYMIQDPNAFYATNINDLIQEKNIEFENAIDVENQKVMEIVEMLPGNNLSGLHELNEKHKLAYGLMLIGFDVAIDIRNQIDKTIKNKDEGFEAYLATPWKPTAIQREQFAATQAEQDIKNNPDNKNQILQKLANNFGYIHQDYLGQPWTALDYEKSFDDNITLQSGMDESYNLSNLSEYEAWLVTIFKKMTYMYEEGRNAMVRTVWAMKETAKQIGLSPETLLYMTASEVEQYSLGKMEAISDELVAIRKKYFAVHFDNGIYSEYSGEAEVRSLIEREKIEFIWKDSDETVDTLKGSIAFKGYVKGKVRLVFTQDDANQVQEGEILVSPMTQVEFLSGIRKCAAIVTDEGGIICHAAIVSREFSKPCILATQKATKVLKNGDLVEVDANKGIVTKLS